MTKWWEDTIESIRDILTLQRELLQIGYDGGTPQIDYDGQSEPAILVCEREEDDNSSSKKSFVAVDLKSSKPGERMLVVGHIYTQMKHWQKMKKKLYANIKTKYHRN